MIYVLYHADCMDGFIAAWCSTRNLESVGKVEYIPVRYNEPPPPLYPNSVVYILDFSYPPEVLMELGERHVEVNVLDHHETAYRDVYKYCTEKLGVEAQELNPLMPQGAVRFKLRKNVVFYFSAKHSGAVLSDVFFNGRSSENWIASYVEDRDLWKFEKWNTVAINAYLSTVERTFAKFDWIYKTQTPATIAPIGIGCVQQMESYVQTMKKRAYRVDFAGHESIPFVNAPRPFISELLNELAKDVLFSVGWNVTEKALVEVSLRSAGDYHVGELARTFGGGGHMNAAGFTTTIEYWMSLGLFVPRVAR